MPSRIMVVLGVAAATQSYSRVGARECRGLRLEPSQRVRQATSNPNWRPLMSWIMPHYERCWALLVDLVGPLPDTIQERLTFSGGVLAPAPKGDDAASVPKFLARREFAELYHCKGLLPKDNG